LRFVLDTDVLVAALRSRDGASWQLVDRALKREFTLLLSVPLILEYEAVLTREEHRKVHDLVPDVDELINSLASVAESVQIRFLWRLLLSDPTDDMVLETAVNGRADLLVTFNQEDFAAAAKGFAVKIVRPSEAMHRLRAHTRANEKDKGCETKQLSLTVGLLVTRGGSQNSRERGNIPQSAHQSSGCRENFCLAYGRILS
jgi:putative PIN family toxin of toxin-antitoxin system